jgi:parallel beta-helix repeat protein
MKVAFVYYRRFWCSLLVLSILTLGLWPSAAPALADDSGEDGLPGQPARWDVGADLPTLDVAAPNALDAVGPADCLGAPTRTVRYTSDGVIHLAGCGQTFRLSDILAAGIGPDKLELSDRTNKIWLLKVKLKVEEGATLVIDGGATGDASWLRLLSTATTGIWLRTDNGNLRFQNTKVTSWDPARNGPDTDPAVAPDGSGGRSYIAARSVLTKGRPTAPPTACGVNGGSQEPYEGRMDVVSSELSYLGYYASESYGVVWKVYYKVNPADPNDAPPPGRQLYALVDIFGNVSSSSFHHNYFGSYTFGAYCMSWSANTFANNVMYGLDPHDDSDYLTIAGNVFRDNGTHGVICSVECDHLVIRNNQSYGNEHGIMLHRNTNGAIMEGNVSRDNRGAGIAIFDSHDAVVRNNIVANNGESAIRLSVGSSRNLIENNTLTGLAASGVGSGYVIYTYKGSDPPTSGDGRPNNNVFRNNRLTAYKSPLMKLGDATGNLFEGNTIAGTTANLSFINAPANTIRNSPISQPIQLTLDSASSVTLADTRGAAWQLNRAGLDTTVTAAGASLQLTFANAGSSVIVTTLNLLMRPQNGALIVNTAAWSATTRAWSERSSSTTGTVTHQLGALTPGACYAVSANSQTIGNYRADSTGHIAFDYSGGYGTTIQFRAAPAPCVSGAPTYSVFLPLNRR